MVKVLYRVTYCRSVIWKYAALTLPFAILLSSYTASSLRTGHYLTCLFSWFGKTEFFISVILCNHVRQPSYSKPNKILVGVLSCPRGKGFIIQTPVKYQVSFCAKTWSLHMWKLVLSLSLSSHLKRSSLLWLHNKLSLFFKDSVFENLTCCSIQNKTPENKTQL